MKQTAWTPSSLNLPVTLGQKIVASSVLSIDTHSALINPAILSPVPGMPYRVSGHTGNLHIHPAFSFQSAIKYFVNSAKEIITDKATAVSYLGLGKANGGLDAVLIPVTLAFTTVGGGFTPGAVLTLEYNHSAMWSLDFYYAINAGDPVLIEAGVSPTGTFIFDTTGLVFNVLTIIVKDSESTLQDTVDFTAVVKSLIIDSLNNGDPFYFIGEFTEGVRYFFSTDGDVVPSSSPFRSSIYVGTGNADKNIDIAIKTLTLELDAFSVSILLDVNFTVSGTATLVSNKVYIEAYNGSVWIDLNAGNPVNVVLGEFELTTAQLKASDGFEGGNVYVVRVRDFDGYATSSTENIETYDMIYGTTEEGGAVVEDEMGNIFTFSD